MGKVVYKSAINIILPSGAGKKEQDNVINRSAPLFAVIADTFQLRIVPEISFRYEDEMHEMQGSHQPVVSWLIESEVPTAYVAMDLHMFFLALSRLFQIDPELHFEYEVFE